MYRRFYVRRRIIYVERSLRKKKNYNLQDQASALTFASKRKPGRVKIIAFERFDANAVAIKTIVVRQTK